MALADMIVLGQSIKSRLLQVFGPVDPSHEEEILCNDGYGTYDSSQWVPNTEAFKSWWNGTSSTPILWIHGDTGLGKTTLFYHLLAGIANWPADPQTDLKTPVKLAKYFLQKDDNRSNTATALAKGLLFLLVSSMDDNNSDPLLNALGQRYARHDQMSALHFESFIPALDMIIESTSNRIVLAVDGLDECIGGCTGFLEYMNKPRPASNIKWLITSRNKSSIRNLLPEDTRQSSICLGDESLQMRWAMDRHIEGLVADVFNWAEPDPDEVTEFTNMLRDKAGCNFLWATVASQATIWSTPHGFHARPLNKFPTGLSALYDVMLDLLHDGLDKKYSKEECVRIANVVAFARRPLDTRAIALFADLGLYKRSDGVTWWIDEAFDPCKPFVISASDLSFVKLRHPSMRDYLQSAIEGADAYNPQEKLKLHKAMAKQGRSIFRLYREKRGYALPYTARRPAGFDSAAKIDDLFLYSSVDSFAHVLAPYHPELDFTDFKSFPAPTLSHFRTMLEATFDGRLDTWLQMLAWSTYLGRLDPLIDAFFMGMRKHYQTTLWRGRSMRALCEYFPGDPSREISRRKQRIWEILGPMTPVVAAFVSGDEPQSSPEV